MPYIKGKGWFDSAGHGIGSARKIDLVRARIAGHDGDTAEFTRLVCESRVSRAALTEAYRAGMPKAPERVRPANPERDERHARMMAQLSKLPPKDPNL